VLAGVKALRFASTRRAAGFGLDAVSAQATLAIAAGARSVVCAPTVDHRNDSEVITREARM